MIKLNINNQGLIEISQEVADGNINIDVLDSKGKVDYYYTVTAEEMVSLLNYYQYKTNKGEELI